MPLRFGSFQDSRNDGDVRTHSNPDQEEEASMTRLKKLFRRLDAFTLETFNPPHARPRSRPWAR
jgi:hypothetical protein